MQPIPKFLKSKNLHNKKHKFETTNLNVQFDQLNY